MNGGRSLQRWHCVWPAPLIRHRNSGSICNGRMISGMLRISRTRGARLKRLLRPPALRLPQGLQQGLAVERTLLIRQARRRFSKAWAEALALLETCAETETQAEVGEWV